MNQSDAIKKSAKMEFIFEKSVNFPVLNIRYDYPNVENYKNKFFSEKCTLNCVLLNANHMVEETIISSERFGIRGVMFLLHVSNEKSCFK